MRVVAFAYACEPDKGSEPGAGWTWTRMIAHSAETWVITRTNNKTAIEAMLADLPERESLRFIYVDLPRRYTFWKRGQRGVRLYYGLWQIAALVRARRLHREIGFDVAWHLTLANAWIGSTASFVGCRFVYGPVGGGVDVPWRLIRLLGVRGTIYEVGRAASRLACRYLNPLARFAWRRAEIVLAQNPETRDWIPGRYRPKTRVLQHAVALDVSLKDAAERPVEPTALFVGRLIPWKGGALALMALTRAPTWKLVVCGTGSDERRLCHLAKKLGVAERVEFCGKVDRAEVDRRLLRCDVLLHPSLHDDSPLAVTEALARGVPVVSLDRGGTPILAGRAGLAADIGQPIESICDELGQLLAQTRIDDWSGVAKARAAELSFEATSLRIAAILREALESVVEGRESQDLSAS